MHNATSLTFVKFPLTTFFAYLRAPACPRIMLVTLGADVNDVLKSLSYNNTAAICTFGPLLNVVHV